MYIIYVNNTLPLAHEISRHFWAAYELTGQKLHNEYAQCDMRGDTGGSDSGNSSVYFLFRGS